MCSKEVFKRSHGALLLESKDAASEECTLHQKLLVSVLLFALTAVLTAVMLPPFCSFASVKS